MVAHPPRSMIMNPNTVIIPRKCVEAFMVIKCRAAAISANMEQSTK